MSGRSWDWKTIKQELIDQGWVIEPKDGRHAYCVPPDKSKPKVFVSTDSGDARAIKCAVRDLRRSGYEPEVQSKRQRQHAPPPTLGDLLAARGQKLPPASAPNAVEPVQEEFAKLPDLFGEALRVVRERHDFSQQEFAELLGITQGTVSQYERCATLPSKELYIEFVKLLPELEAVPRPEGLRSFTTKPGRKRDQACGVCDAPGHNARSCPNKLALQASENLPVPPPPPMPAPPHVVQARKPDSVDDFAPVNGPRKLVGLELLERCISMVKYLHGGNYSLRIGEEEPGVWLCVVDDPEGTETAIGRGKTAAGAVSDLAHRLKTAVEARRSKLDALLDGVG